MEKYCGFIGERLVVIYHDGNRLYYQERKQQRVWPQLISDDYKSSLSVYNVNDVIYYMYLNLLNHLMIGRIPGEKTNVLHELVEEELTVSNCNTMIWGNENTIYIEVNGKVFSFDSMLESQEVVEIFGSGIQEENVWLKEQIENARTQYSELADYARKLQDEGKYWRSKCYNKERTD